MVKVEKVIPHIPSVNIQKTVEFMASIFGTTSEAQSELYSEVYLDGNTIGVLASQGEPNQQSVYLQVDDVDAIWEDKQSELEAIQAKAPFTQAYGMREVHLVIPETRTLLFIGSKVSE